MYSIIQRVHESKNEQIGLLLTFERTQKRKHERAANGVAQRDNNHLCSTPWRKRNHARKTDGWGDKMRGWMLGHCREAVQAVDTTKHVVYMKKKLVYNGQCKIRHPRQV